MKMRWIKIGIVLFLLVYLVLLCTRDTARNVSMDSITEQMEKDTTITELKKGDASMLRRFYGLSEADFEGIFFYKAESPMLVDELLIVKAKNKSQAVTALESAESHLAGQKKSFEGYGVTQSAQLAEAVLECKGNYAIYAAGENAGKWKEEFLKIIK